MSRWTLALIILAALSCSSPSDSCTWREAVQRVFFGDPVEAVQRAWVTARESEGWECEMEQLIGLDGEPYGERWTCRICD